jgi:hypothetical protein
MPEHDDRFRPKRDADHARADTPRRRRTDKQVPNPPHTTKHGVTAPKFGSAGSGGAEIEPGLDKN